MSDLFPKSSNTAADAARRVARRATALAAAISFLVLQFPQRRSSLSELELSLDKTATTLRVASGHLGKGLPGISENVFSQPAKVFDRCSHDFARFAESALNGDQKKEFSKIAQEAEKATKAIQDLAAKVRGEELTAQLPEGGYVTASGAPGRGIG